MISLGTWPYRQPGFLKEALQFVGMRAYGVEAAVGVRNGRIMETEFGVSTEATPGSIGGQWLAAVAKVSDRVPESQRQSVGFRSSVGPGRASSIATYRVH